MPRASWNGTVIAETAAETAADTTGFESVEGNVYFPPDTVRRENLRDSSTTTVCSWKGTAHYYDVVVGDDVNRDAAWYYPDPKPAAANIKDHVAFWRGVKVDP